MTNFGSDPVQSGDQARSSEYTDRNWLIFLGIWGEAKLILRIWGAKENIFREQRYFLSGSWGDQCIIFGDKGAQTIPPSGKENVKCDKFFKMAK